MRDNESHIIYSAADIEKYWKGELSAAEQHAMEKAALDDPLLADALEGYEQRIQQSTILSDDTEELRKKLAARVSTKKETPTIPMRWWKAAAIFIVIGGAGSLFLFLNRSSETKQLARNADSVNNAPTALAKDRDTIVSGLAADSNRDVAIERIQIPEPKKALLPNREREAAAPVASEPMPAAAGAANNTDAAAPKEQEVGKKEDLAMTKNNKQNAAREITTQQQKASGIAIEDDRRSEIHNNMQQMVLAPNTFSGNLKDQSNRPVPNAVIQIPQLNVTTQTDKKGYFSFSAKDTSLNLSVESNGFITQNVYLRNKATLNQITLKPIHDSLGEVVTQSNGAEKRKKSALQELTITIPDAEPVGGWEAYREYLQKNKKTPAGFEDVHGTVVLSFEVHNKWFGNYSIDQSLEDELDAEAIRLVKEGPAWKLLKGKKATATVIVKF